MDTLGGVRAGSGPPERCPLAEMIFTSQWSSSQLRATLIGIRAAVLSSIRQRITDKERSAMRRLRIQLLAATGLIATASFAGSSAAWASVGAKATGAPEHGR